MDKVSRDRRIGELNKRMNSMSKQLATLLADKQKEEERLSRTVEKREVNKNVQLLTDEEATAVEEEEFAKAFEESKEEN